MVFRRFSLLVLASLLAPIQVQASPISWLGNVVYWVGDKKDAAVKAGINFLAHKHKYAGNFSEAALPHTNIKLTSNNGQLSLKTSDNTPVISFKKFKYFFLSHILNKSNLLSDFNVSNIYRHCLNQISTPQIIIDNQGARTIYPRMIVDNQEIVAAQREIQGYLSSKRLPISSHLSAPLDQEQIEALKGFEGELQTMYELSRKNPNQLAHETFSVIVGTAVIIGVVTWYMKKKYTQWKKNSKKEVDQSINPLEQKVEDVVQA